MSFKYDPAMETRGGRAHARTGFVLQDVFIRDEVHAQRLPVFLVQLLQLGDAQDVVKRVSCILYFNLSRTDVCVALKHRGLLAPL